MHHTPDSVPDKWGVAIKNQQDQSYMTWQIPKKFLMIWLAVGIDLLEFIIDTLPWKLIWNSARSSKLGYWPCMYM